MSNKKILIMTAAFIMSVLTFSGCGKEETNPASAESEAGNAEESEIAEEPIQEEDTSVDSSVDTETSQEVIEPVLSEEMTPFMEENGVIFDIVPETPFTLYTYISADEVVQEKENFQTVLTNVSTFKSSDAYAEVEGYTYQQGTFIIYSNVPNRGVNFQAYICDYYTGEIIEFEGDHNVSAEMTKDLADTAFIVKIGETEYSITAFSDFQMTDNGWELTFTALVPDEYDGLCLCIGGTVKDEENSEDESGEDAEEPRQLITDADYGAEPETWHFYRMQTEEQANTAPVGTGGGGTDVEVSGETVGNTALTQEEIEELNALSE